MTDLPFRVQPALDDENRFFWTSGADGALRFARGGSCGYWLHPPLPRCPKCGSRAVALAAGTEPYAIGLVELAEQPGLRLTTDIVGCALDDVHIGMTVRVTFEQHGIVFFPLFEPDPDAVSGAEA